MPLCQMVHSQCLPVVFALVDETPAMDEGSKVRLFQQRIETLEVLFPGWRIERDGAEDKPLLCRVRLDRDNRVYRPHLHNGILTIQCSVAHSSGFQFNPSELVTDRLLLPDKFASMAEEVP